MIASVNDHINELCTRHDLKLQQIHLFLMYQNNPSLCTSSLSDFKKSHESEESMNSCNKLVCFDSKSNPINSDVLCQIVDQTSDISMNENNTTAIMNLKIHDKENLMEVTNRYFSEIRCGHHSMN